MKGKISCIILLCFLFVVSVGCESRKNQLKDSGLFGEHSLLRIESFGPVVQGSVSGSFFLGIGSVNGSISSEFKIQFYWCPKPGEVVVTALPYSKFRFIIDETKSSPTVDFVFDEDWLEKEFKINCENLNDHVMSKNMVVARVRISSATLEKEIYLPKVR